MRVIAFLLFAATAVAQQTGTVVGSTPGSPFGKGPRASQVARPKPTCDAPASAASMPNLPDMIFNRESLVCVRHADGSSAKVFSGSSQFALANDGDHLAYWSAAKHELHIYAIAARTDTLIDTIPGISVRELAWSTQGRTLSYTLHGVTPATTRTFDLDTGKREVLTGASATSRFPLTPATAAFLAQVPNADSAEYSRNGHLIAILAINADGPGNNATDDEPDCTGGVFALHVANPATKQLLKIPFPQGFDSVLDYNFSPDDHSVAITFGAAACDYPGDVARVYSVSLPDLKLTPLSPANRLSVKARWTPDGKSIIYSDYTGSNSPLVAVDLATGQRTVLTTPGDNGPDELLGWHAPNP